MENPPGEGEKFLYQSGSGKAFLNEGKKKELESGRT